MSLHHVLTDIRKLCCLGFGGQLVMPALLKTVHDLVPSYCNTFAWAGADGELSNFITEPNVSPDLIRLYFREFYNTREAEVRPTFTQSMRQEQGVGDWEQYYGTARFLRSDFYNRLMRPLDLRYILRGYVPAAASADGRNIGVLTLVRQAHAKPFSNREKSLLSSILPYISHALNAPGQQPVPYADHGQAGLLIVDQQGDIQAADTVGQYLLLLASHAIISPATLTDLAPPSLPPLKGLIENVTRLSQGLDAMPPSIQLHNSWGQFTFQTHLLNQQRFSSEMLAGITIRHDVPRQINLLQAMKASPLSAKQKEVCLWLLEGLSQNNIAEQMGISPHSVNDYLKKTYRKLEVHSKDELLKKLLSPA